MGFAGRESWNSCNLVTTNWRADATSTSRLVMLLNIEVDATGVKAKRGSDAEVDENLSSLPAVMTTIG